MTEEAVSTLVGDEGETSVDTTIADVDINAIVSSEGPIVGVVILQTDGTVIEEEMDMTPKKKNVQARLGGEVTFVGMYHNETEVEGVVVVVRKNAKEQGLILSKHVLQPPFHREEIYGDLLLMRTSAEAVPVGFSRKEYESFAARTDIPDVVLDDESGDDVFDLAGSDDEDEESGESDGDGDSDDDHSSGDEEIDSDEDEDEEVSAVFAMMMPMLLKKFESQHGRKPSEKELANITNALAVKFGITGASGKEDTGTVPDETAAVPDTETSAKATDSVDGTGDRKLIPGALKRRNDVTEAEGEEAKVKRADIGPRKITR